MNILFSINHPAHVHFFRNSMPLLKERGHAVHITHRKKDITEHLLRRYGLDSRALSTQRRGLVGMARELIHHERQVHALLKTWHIDVALAIGGTFVVHACRLRGVPAIAFSDTESAGLQNAITYPFATRIVTPACYRDELGRKQTRYKGYHELAYLHPGRFTPEPGIRELLGVRDDEPYVIMRFVGWEAAHDRGHAGISETTKRKAVEAFSAHARVFITSEKELSEDLEPYRIAIPPERMHDALNYAALLYGESATMASEAAVLGTPAIYVDNEGRGYTDEQEQRYGLVFNFTESESDLQRSVAKGIELLSNGDETDRWQAARQRLLADTIDVTEWMVQSIEAWGRPCAG